MAMIVFQALVVVIDYTYAAPVIIEPVFVHVTAACHGFRQSPQHHFYNGSVGENLLRSRIGNAANPPRPSPLLARAGERDGKRRFSGWKDSEWQVRRSPGSQHGS
jgi:hypothetical protein